MADFGACGMQPEEAALAGFCAKRHWRHQNFMAGIHNIIMKMRAAMKEEREKVRKQSNPMEDGQKEKVLIPVKLAYKEEGKICNRLEIRKV